MKISHVKLLLGICIVSLSFFMSTECFAAPTVVSVSPEDGEEGTAIDVPLVITFSEEMSIAEEDTTIAAGPCGESCPTFDIAWSGGNTILTLERSDGLYEADTTYTIEISARSALDEAMAAPFEWSFSTYVPLVLTQIKQIPQHATVEEAIYYFSLNDEEGDVIQYEVDACSQNDDNVETLINGTNHTLFFTGLVEGNSYRCSFQATSLDRGTSNMLQVGPFTVYRQTSASGSNGYGCTDPLASNYKKNARSKPEMCVYKDTAEKSDKPVTVVEDDTNKDTGDGSSVVQPFIFQKNLSFGMVDSDIVMLQKKLNSLGFNIAETGPGSSGYETDYFGEKTRAAVEKFQQAHQLPVVGIVGPRTRALLNSL